MPAVAALVLLACCAAPAVAATQQVKSVFSAGGGAASSGTTRVTGNLGDVIVGRAMQATRQVSSGFWVAKPHPALGVNPDPSEAVGFFLNRPQPNPARNATLIGFGLGRSDRVALRIYDISGRMVRELASGTRQPGIYNEAWNLRSDAGARVPAGIYFSRFESASFSAMRKVVVLH